MPLEAVLFDLDGTLIDSYAAIAEAFNHARVCLGEPELPEPTVRRMVGHGLEALMQKSLGSRRMQAGVDLFRQRYESICEARTRLLSGVRETISILHRGGIRMGVATNKPEPIARRLLTRLQIMPPIRAVRGPGGATPAKPDPAMLHAVLQGLGVDPCRALFVGDMPIDVEAARRAGLAVWVLSTGSSTGRELEAARPDRILSGFEELQSLAAGRPAVSA